MPAASVWNNRRTDESTLRMETTPRIASHQRQTLSVRPATAVRARDSGW